MRNSTQLESIGFKMCLILIALVFTGNLEAQVYTMSQNGSNTVCSGSLCDSGGLNNDYSDNESLTHTLSPDSENAKIRVYFSSFSLENNYDFLKIYDGPSTSSPLIGDFTDNDILYATVTSTHDTGALTFRFTSDESNTEAGFTADISCVDMGVQIDENEEEVDSDLILSPNPSLGHLSLTINNPYIFNGEVEIVDMLGKTVYRNRIDSISNDHFFEFDLSSEEAGMYFVNVKYTDGKVISGKFLKL